MSGKEKTPEVKELQDECALTLERSQLWRRAAARWLAVMDGTVDARVREQVALRREACLIMADKRQHAGKAGPGVGRNRATRMLRRIGTA